MTENTSEYPIGDWGGMVPDLEYDLSPDLPEQLEQWMNAHPEETAIKIQGDQI